MNKILPSLGRPARRRPVVWLCLAALPACGSIFAGTDADTPDGLPVGRAVFAPWFETSVLADDNIFREADTLAQQPDADVATTFRGGFWTYIPVRMSELQIGYEGNTFSYRDSEFDGTDTHTGSLLFDLNFSNNSTLHLEQIYTDGATELSTLDEGSEPVRQGIPYVRNDWAVEWVREARRGPSWRARLGHRRLDYSRDVAEVVPWLDYDGHDIEYDFGRPIYRRGGLLMQYRARRMDQFGDSPSIVNTIPIRREVFDTLEIGFQGLIGRKQPLQATIGYGRLAYRDVQDGDEPANYKGLVGGIRWRLPVGGASNLSLDLSRRPNASIYNTYYLVNEFRVRLDRRFGQISRYGVVLMASRNEYGSEVTKTANGNTTSFCTGLVRSDQRAQVEGFWEWFLQSRVALRLRAAHNGRDSNCKQVEYDSNAVGLTVKVGWF